MDKFTTEEIETIVDHALIALLWSSGDEYNENDEVIQAWDETYDENDATPELRAALTESIAWLDRADIMDPIALQWRMAAHEYVKTLGLEQFGHDMTLTRGHHGAGFWDRGIGAIGDVLTVWAESLGYLNIFHGSDSITPEKWEGMFHAE